MEARPKDYLNHEELLLQIAEESAELAQAAIKERRSITRANPTPVTYNEAHKKLLEEVADVLVCIGELLEIDDWDVIANIKKAKLSRWLARLEGTDEKED